jgi:hypothetical protein
MSKNQALIDRITCKVDEKPEIKQIAKHHIESFNYALKDVLEKFPKYMRPMEIKSTEITKNIFQTMTISYKKFELG